MRYIRMTHACLYVCQVAWVELMLIVLELGCQLPILRNSTSGTCLTELGPSTEAAREFRLIRDEG